VSGPRLFGAIEGGGTKFVCSIGRGLAAETARVVVPTTTPEETLARVVDAFAPYRDRLVSVGLACFGPLELDRAAGDAYGGLLATPKPGWSHVPIRATLQARLGVPVAVDTDVNAAALAEVRQGALAGADVAVYVTVGAGVGAGVVLAGRPHHGLLHAEAGHLLPPLLLRADGKPDDFGGVCPFHARCVEGLASGTAVAARTGRVAEALRSDDPVWPLVAGYLGHLLAAITLVLSPHRIALGGGVLRAEHLRPRVRAALGAVLAGYLPRPQLVRDLDAYVVAPRLGDDAGLAGAYLLAADAFALGPT
jgi:fructokinase